MKTMLFAVMLTFIVFAFAGNDQPWNESAKEEELSECRSDPKCWSEVQRMMAAQEKRDQAAQVRWEQKNTFEKLLPWGVIAALCWGAWSWLGSNKKK